MPNPRRIERLEQHILRTLGPEISQLADPRLGLVTVTRVRLSKDLGVARVNWSCVGTEAERSRSAHALEHARGYLTGVVADAMTTRNTPRLEFHFDESMQNAVRISQILHQLAVERGEDPDADAAAEGEADAETATDEASDESDESIPDDRP